MHFGNRDAIKITNKPAIVDSNLAPGAAVWRTRPSMRVTFDSDPLTPLCANVTPSTNRNYVTDYTVVGGEPSNSHR